MRAIRVPTDPAHDFDFLMGAWRIHNRRLRERLRGSDEWDEFETTSLCRPIWGGRANVDEVTGETPAGPLAGLTLRLLDPASGQWRLYWSNARIGIQEQPLVGTFVDGRGEFYDHELLEGRGILCRFVWSDITAVSCRWEQAFSDDGGRSWETNWIMEFTRAE